MGDAQAQTWLGHRAQAAHLGHGDVAVPVGDLVAVTGEGDAVDASQAIGRRDDDRLAEAVEVVTRIELARALGIEDHLHRGIDGGGQRDDRTGIEVTVGPAIEAFADAGRERVVYGRVAQRAGDAHARQLIDAV